MTGPAARLIANWQHLAMLNSDIPDDPAAADIVYIAGPMTGYPEWNHPEFHAAAAVLRAKGLRVINPAELHEAEAATPWGWYLRRDLAQLVKCNRVVLLPGWHGSRGAQLEHHVAQALGMTITYPTEDTEA